MLPPLSGPARDVALLIARVLLGVVLFAHGFHKVFTYGLSSTTAAFTKIGVPVAPAAAAYASIVELVGGGLKLVPIIGAVSTRVTTKTEVSCITPSWPKYRGMRLLMLGCCLFLHRTLGLTREPVSPDQTIGDKKVPRQVIFRGLV